MSSFMDLILDELPKKAKKAFEENKKYFKKLKKRIPKKLDLLMQELHDNEFAKTNCLDCAHCCKTTSPIFTEKDILRIAKHLRMRPRKFSEQYLHRDSGDFMVLKTAPCPFLDEYDHSCHIYHVRPKACAEYPHTNRKKFIQLTDLTIKNTKVCPAAYNIVEALKQRFPR